MPKMSPKTLRLCNQDIIIREAVPTDAERVIELLTVIANETPFTFNYPGQQLKPENVTARLTNEQASPTNIKIIALAGDTVIGQIGLWRNNAEHPWLSHKGEFAMMVVKAWWGTGLAKALLTEMETFARATGVKRIDATVSATNERGIGLYSKFGYEIEGTAKAYKIVNGQALDSHYIAKML